MSYNDGVAFATTAQKFAILEALRDRRQMAAGDDRVCELGAARGPIRLLRHFNGGASAKSQRRKEFVAEEKKSECSG